MRKLISLFLLTFVIQIFISLIIYNKTVDTEYLGFSYGGDDYIYGRFGMVVADLWRRGIPATHEELEKYNISGAYAVFKGYQLHNILMFYIFGKHGAKALLVLNCLFHAGIIIPAYFILKNLGISDRVRMYTLFLFLFWPSTFTWALFNFKDTMLLFFTFMILFILVEVGRKARLIYFVFLPFLFYILFYLQNYLIALFPIAALSILVFGGRRHVKPILISFIIMIISCFLLYPTQNLRFDILPQHLYYIRYVNKFSNTPYFTHLLTYTYLRTLLYIPLGVMATLFLPFLLRPFNYFQIIANIETMAWWFLLPFLLSGVWIALKEMPKKIFPFLLLFCYWLLILSLTHGNMGTLIRHKALIYYIGFIFVAVAFDYRIKTQKAK